MVKPDLALEVISLPVADQERAKHFFVELLGFELRADEAFHGENGRWITVVAPGTKIAFTLCTWFPSMAPGSMRGLVLGTTDIGVTYARFRERGIDVDPPSFEPGGRFTQFRDSEGNHWILQERKTAPGFAAPAAPAARTEKTPSMTTPEAADLLDAYLLGERRDRDAVFAQLAGWHTDIEAAAPIIRALSLVGSRAADESLIALRIALGGGSPDDDAVRRARSVLAAANQGDAHAKQRYLDAVGQAQ